MAAELDTLIREIERKNTELAIAAEIQARSSLFFMAPGDPDMPCQRVGNKQH